MNYFFYSEDCPVGVPVNGGIFYRTMGLGRFIKDCEEKGYHIVGIRLDEENNGELLFTGGVE
jgi:hypothetical protein